MGSNPFEKTLPPPLRKQAVSKVDHAHFIFGFKKKNTKKQQKYTLNRLDD